MSQKRWQGMAIGLLTLALTLALTRTVRADGGAGESSVTVNGYQIALVFAEPATVGENEYHVQVTDEMGMPIATDEVEVTAMLAAAMPQHADEPASSTPGMDSMNGMSGMSDMPGMAAPTPSADMNMDGMNMSSAALPAETAPHDAQADGHAEAGAAEHAEAITAVLKPGAEEGEYAGKIDLDQAGDWMFHVHFTRNGAMTEAQFAISVVEAARNYGVLLAFLIFNVGVLMTAALLKKRKAVIA